MKKYLSLALLVLCLGTLASCSADQQATAVESYTAPDPYQIPCGAGYSRIAPHQCIGTGSVNVVLSKNVCSSVTVSTSFGGVPTTAKALQLLVDSTVTGTNTLNAIDTSAVIFYTGAGCATPQSSFFQFDVKEFVANLNTEIGQMTQNVIIQDISNTIWYQYFVTSGGASSVSVTMAGYYD